MKVDDVKLGDKLRVTEDKPCLSKGTICEVKQDEEDGYLYVDCAEETHWLSYDTDAHKNLKGFEPV